MSDEDWGPWIEHDHSHVPQNVLGRYVQCIDVGRAGNERGPFEGYLPNPLPKMAHICWLGGGVTPAGWACAITRYRIRRFRAEQTLREIAEGVREPEVA